MQKLKIVFELSDRSQQKSSGVHASRFAKKIEFFFTDIQVCIKLFLVTSFAYIRPARCILGQKIHTCTPKNWSIHHV